MSEEYVRLEQTAWVQEVGLLIRELRTERTLSLRDVSRRASISIGHLSEVERGVKSLSFPLLKNLADGLSITPSELFIEIGFRLAEIEVPDTPEELLVRDERWQDQYSDLVG